MFCANMPPIKDLPEDVPCPREYFLGEYCQGWLDNRICRGLIVMADWLGMPPVSLQYLCNHMFWRDQVVVSVTSTTGQFRNTLCTCPWSLRRLNLPRYANVYLWDHSYKPNFSGKQYFHWPNIAFILHLSMYIQLSILFTKGSGAKIGSVHTHSVSHPLLKISLNRWWGSAVEPVSVLSHPYPSK